MTSARVLTGSLVFFLFLCSSFVSASTTAITLISSDPGFSILVKQLQRNRLVTFINDRKTGTFFAPTNAAFNKWFEDHGVHKSQHVPREVLLYHILPDSYETQSFKDGMLLETELVKYGYLGDNNEGQLVAVAKASWRPGRRSRFTVGNADLIKADWIADNCVVHVVDQMLEPPGDLVETMQKHAELEAIYNIIHGAGLDSLLKEHRPFTVFAPTDNALAKLNRIQVHYFKDPEGFFDLQSTFQHHVHEGTLYKRDISEGSTGISTVQGQDLLLYQDAGKKLLVDNAEVEKMDILASNGVIHTVVRPLLPSALVWTPAKYLIGMNASGFVHQLRDAGLSHYIDSPDASYTFFAPQDDDESKETMKAMMKDAEPIDVLKYHVVPGRRQLSSFHDGSLLDTELHTEQLNGLAQRSKITVKQDRKNTVISVNGVEVIGEPVQVGKSVIYLLKKPLVLPLPLVKMIKQDATLSAYVDALSATDLSRRLSDAREVTVFAPSTQAWSDLGVVANYLHLNQDESLKALEDVVRYTVVEGVHYTDNIKSGSTVLKTSEGSGLVVEKNGDTIHVGEGRLERNEQVGGKVVRKDILVESGVIHTVSSVALPPTLSITLYNVLQGAGTKNFLKAFENSNITRILTDWEQDFTIFAPTDEAFARADLEGALNDIDFVARLVRLHVMPGRILKLEEDVEEDGASMLNQEARLSLRDIHGDGKSFGVRVKGARSKKEAKIVAFGSAHPAWPKESEGEGEGDGDGENEDKSSNIRRTTGMTLQGASAVDEDGVSLSSAMRPFKEEARPSGIVYIIDRVLLPGDPDPMGEAWFWISVIMLALLGTMVLCVTTVVGVHALVAELRELEGRNGYAPVSTRGDGGEDEEAAIGRRELDPESVPPATVPPPAPVADDGAAAEDVAPDQMAADHTPRLDSTVPSADLNGTTPEDLTQAQ
ncbi:hypothetical protein BG004_001433 [Podila humilis]|nr:hypothetical protein BG004_001433 [Podila humilis]